MRDTEETVDKTTIRLTNYLSQNRLTYIQIENLLNLYIKRTSTEGSATKSISSMIYIKSGIMC